MGYGEEGWKRDSQIGDQGIFYSESILLSGEAVKEELYSSSSWRWVKIQGTGERREY